jgi:hypothetical protein
MPEVIQTPRPPSPPDEEPKTDPSAPVTKGDLKKSLRLNEVWTVLVAVATAAAALLGGYALFISKAEAAGQEAAKKVAERQDKLEESQKEVKLDMRDLYKAVMYGKRSERLERPPVDLPARDAGP